MRIFSDLIGGMPPELRGFLILLVIVLIIGLAVIFILDGREKRRLMYIMWGYAGYDQAKHFMQEAVPSSVELRRGLRKQTGLLMRRIRVITEQMDTQGIPVPEFFNDAVQLLPNILEWGFHKQAGEKLPVGFSQLLTKARTYCIYEKKIVDPVLKKRLEAWCTDTEDWAAIVKQFGRSVEWYAKWEERNSSLYK